jgi:hypothetical protein
MSCPGCKQGTSDEWHEKCLEAKSRLEEEGHYYYWADPDVRIVHGVGGNFTLEERRKKVDIQASGARVSMGPSKYKHGHEAAMQGRAFGVALKDIEMGQLVTLDDVRLINQHVTVKE